MNFSRFLMTTLLVGVFVLLSLDKSSAQPGDKTWYYQVELNTGNRWLAGTRARVFIQLIDYNGDTSSEIPLGSSVRDVSSGQLHLRLFQSLILTNKSVRWGTDSVMTTAFLRLSFKDMMQTDVFNISVNMYELTEIRIHCDCSGWASEWYLKGVTVNGTYGNIWFDFSRWLADGIEEAQTVDSPTCNGKTTVEGGCDAYYPHSHLVLRNGHAKTRINGSCPSSHRCLCNSTGFYSTGGSCDLCPDISHCQFELCSSKDDVTCEYCEGVVQNQLGYRAYKMSSNRTLCQQACSWRKDSNRCYPGNCSEELTTSCVCSPGFFGKHCRHLTQGPDIKFNELKIKFRNQPDMNVPPDLNAGPSDTQNVWTTHVNPTVLAFDFRSQFVPAMPGLPPYIKGKKVGLVGAYANFVLTNKAGIQHGTLTKTCDGLSISEPYTTIFTCKEEINSSFFGSHLPLPFQHEDRLDFTFNSIAGGFVIWENKENNTNTTDYFVNKTTTHSFQLNFDIVDPYHCLNNCSDKMLNNPQTSNTADVTVSWGGWTDDAAGIGKYGYRAYVLTPVNNVLQHASLDTNGFVNTTAGSGTVTFSLTNGPGTYAILLDAYDRAGNVKSARRIILYDGSSKITRNSDAVTPLRVTSASPVTSWDWQITEGDVTVTWTGRYTNVFHDHNKVLDAVAVEGDVENSYDDNEGNMTINATDHVLGIVKFTTAYLIDKQGGSTFKIPPDSSFSPEPGLTGTNTYLAGVVDGDTLTLWVRAYDIRGVYDEEAVTVHVDSSPPVITNLWLTKDHILNVTVHGIEELHTMTMEWEAYDLHSGLRKVAWRVFDNFTNTDIVHGHAYVQKQGGFNNLTHCQSQYADYIRGPNCYCTGPAQCFHRHFQVQPRVIDADVNGHGGIFQDKNTNVHDHDYFLEVTVYNNASLTTTLSTQITVDLSAPHPGAVHDGTAGSPEVDFTSSTSLAVHWSGFFDRESGVKYYQYAFDTVCVNASVFSHVVTDARVNETYNTFASWTAPGDGLYRVTVVAYNSAMMPSKPVCSDGVRVDSTPPALAAFYVQGAIVAGGVVPGSSSGEVWFIGSDRRRRLVKSPDSACVSAASAVTLTLEDYAVSPLTSPIGAKEACGHGALDAKFTDTLYLARDKHLFVNWTGSDAGSGIYDYEVGLASSSSADVPDISGYESTRQHSVYRRHHPALSEGTPFYILVKAINRAGLETVTALGPVTLVRTPPTYTGNVTLTLTYGVLLVAWDTSLLADVEKQLLTFTVSLEDQTSGALLHPHTSPSPSPSAPCPAATPTSCATFDLCDLQWGLHERHVYVARVKVTSLLGLDLQLTSDPYTHDTRLAAAGSVREVVPDGEMGTLGVQRSEDTDFQLSTSTLEVTWSGFEDGSLSVSYRAGLGSSPGADDVIPFTGVGYVGEHTFTGLSLQVNSKYYVTVVATTVAGDVTVSGDGVTVIAADQTESGISVKDGPECSDPGTPAVVQTHHADDVSVPCLDDATFQSSINTLSAHWAMTSAQRIRYPDVLYKVQRNVAGTNVWGDVTSYTASSRNDVIRAVGLALQAGSSYRLGVKFCVSGACALPIYSTGVTVITSPLVTGSMGVEHSNSTGVSVLTVTLADFYDADVTLVSEAKAAVLGYQWALTHKLQDGTRPQISAWADVGALQAVNATHSQFTITLPSELSFHECLAVTVRGVSQTGLVSMVTQDVLDCEAQGPAHVVARDVIDVVGTTVRGSPDQGLLITQGFNAAWTHDDADYTPHNNVISAVWPKLRHTQVTWAVLESQGPDVTSHFLDPLRQPPRDPCSAPHKIACGHVDAKKYINVLFGPGSSRPALQNGRHYTVCVFAKGENVTFEKWVDVLPDVTACSDGVTVDMTSPTAGIVSVDGLLDRIYQTSLNVVSLTWTGFTDIEALGHVAHTSGILSYQVAVGSVEGGEDMVPFTDVGLVNSYTLHSLTLQNGHVYYVSVRALDHVGRCVTATSRVVADSTPPLKTNADFWFPEPYVTSVSAINVCWTAIFKDEESGIKIFKVSVGSRPGHDDIMQTQTVTVDCLNLQSNVTMVNGHSYYVTVGATNGAGMESIATSKPMVVMTTEPSAGFVFDGSPPAANGTNTDIDFVTSPDDVRAFWTGFSTPINPVTSYKVRLGTCPSCDDVMADFDVGLSTEMSWSHAPLRHDVRYFSTVTACNAVDRCRSVTSDGVMIDVTPPVTGPVWDGTGDEDIQYQSQTDFLGAQWRGFSDLGSGLRGFSWRAGTTAGGSDVMAERDVGLVFSAYSAGLSTPLPEDTTVYITVSAQDAAGNKKEVSSNGFKVDTSGPMVTSAPQLTSGAGTLDGSGLVSRDMVSVTWALTDPGSHLASQHLSLASHLYGEFQSAPLQVPGPATRHTFTSLTLHDGSRYRVKVTGCNLAKLCTTTVTADILHDNSPPSTGMFAVETDHSAALTRHVTSWMQWTTSSLRLAWLGFHDQHSGVASYTVSVGTQPYGSDLNVGNTPDSVIHAESGTSHADEGYVQVYEVTTKTLTAGQDVYVTVWGINGVGLKSHPAMSMFRLEQGGAMFLHRRCVPFTCLSHCACAKQGQKCGAVTNCTQYTAADCPHYILTLRDHADLSVFSTASPPAADTHQASLTYLAASWAVTTRQGLAPLRYEISAGRNDSSPKGVLTDRVWRDVGLDNSSVITIPAGVFLTSTASYSTFVRAWYSDGSHAVFKSPGITPVVKPPLSTTKLARAVKEHATPGTDKDVDFVTSPHFVHISWSGKFIATLASVVSHKVFIGTAPKAADVFASPSLNGSTETLHVTGLALEETTLYYSTVTAEGASGLVSSDVSDGFMLDTSPPQHGRVLDGSGLQELDYQPRSDAVNATWHGFYDAGSGVRRYHWCVGTTPDTTLCDVMRWTDVGLMTSGNADLGLPVSQGALLYSKVYAEDATGQKSGVSVSDGVTVDTTAPAVLSLVYTTGVNWVDNPSFEADTALNANLTGCDVRPPTSWQITAGSCVTLHRPAHVISSEGSQHAVFYGTLTQRVTGLTPGAIYRLNLRLATPHNALANQKPVTGHVTLGTEVTPFDLDPSMCRGVCYTGVEPVMMWHSLSYIATASATTLDVEISTAVASPDRQVALDHVVLEEVRPAASAGCQAEPALRNQAVFLPEWSLVQTSWHFSEDASPIVEYQWAVGTCEGGVQLQGFTSVGRRQHASLSGLTLSHGTSVHVTVLARNAADMTSVLYALPLVVDMSPPDIADLRDGSSGNDVDFQSDDVITARWSVSDPQSSVGNCQWAVGTLPGRGDILAFQSATGTPTTTTSNGSSSSSYSVSSDVTSAVNHLTRPHKLYVSVRCYNGAGLAGWAASDGVTVLTDGQSAASTPVLSLLPDSLSHYPALQSCHVIPARLRMRWRNVTSQIPLAGFQVEWASGSDRNSSSTPRLPFLLDAADLDLSSQPLTSASSYNVSVNPVDIFGNVSVGSSHTIHVLPRAPVINANKRVTSSVSGADLTVTWPDLFTSTVTLNYEVSAGSVPGGGDIMLWHLTHNTSVLVSLANSGGRTFKMSVIVTAIDPCGQFVTHNQLLEVTP